MHFSGYLAAGKRFFYIFCIFSIFWPILWPDPVKESIVQPDARFHCVLWKIFLTNEFHRSERLFFAFSDRGVGHFFAFFCMFWPILGTDSDDFLGGAEKFGQ